jgi:hypothetical protein
VDAAIPVGAVGLLEEVSDPFREALPAGARGGLRTAEPMVEPGRGDGSQARLFATGWVSAGSFFRESMNSYLLTTAALVRNKR